MILTRIFDSIMDLQGDFQVLEFTVGKKKGDPSHARLLVKGKNKEHLESILEQVYREGAQPVTVQETRLEPAPRNMVMPDDFYSTTNNATQVYHGGQWIDVQNMMMDKCIVVDIRRKTAECKMVRDIVKGDMVVVGEQGVKIIPLERPREGVDIFQFMSSASSSERPTPHIARKVASDIYNTKKEGGLKAMVDKKILKSGVMYECIKNNVPYVLAGSIRDDGPLPDVVTDVVEAQRKYKEIIKGANMVLMFSTMLHSIAVGNMLPASVKVVAVDISQPVVTKLIDRGTAQAIGIVTDVGAFLPIVVDHLKHLVKQK